MAKRSDEITVINYEDIKNYMLKKTYDKCGEIDGYWEVVVKYPNDKKLRENYMIQCGKLEVLNEVLNYIYKAEKQTIRKDDDENGWLDKMVDAIKENKRE